MSVRTPLPIDGLLDEIADAVRGSPSVILTATPGAGKTTHLPPHLLASVAGKIVVLEPRRMAAVAAANRVCEEQGWRLGDEAGYQVRFESRASRATRLLYMTDALLLRRLVDDPELGEFSLVILDEFHERGLNQDLILGAIRELQELGSPLKLLVMSATLDSDRLARFLGDAPVIDVPGQVHPLDVRYSTRPWSLATDRDFYERVAQAVTGAVNETKGDVLVFLPGVLEITRVEERLVSAGVRRLIFPLHGSLPLAEQNAVLRPSGQPRVILATNVAEASVTVQGVDYVIDAGLSKVNEMNLNSGFSSLELTRISQFNARQRAGRAAREKAGVCLRLWTPHEEVTQPLQMPPESARVGLGAALLLLAHLGVSDFGKFAWFEPPPARLLGAAVKELRAREALDQNLRLTELGRRLLRWPLPPRVGATVAFAEREGHGRLGAWVGAILGDRDFIDRPATTRLECDVTYRLEVLREGRGLNAGARAVLESARQLERLVEPGEWPEEEVAAVRRLLLRSQVDRLCRRRGGGGRGVMVGGRGVRLDDDSQVRESEFFLALQGMDLPGQNETRVSLACGVSKALVLEVWRERIETVEDIEFVEEKGQFFSRRVRRLFDLALEDTTLMPVAPESVSERMAELLMSKWDWLAKQNEALGHWLARWQFLARHNAEWTLPPAAIRQTVELAAFGKTKVADVVNENLVALLESALPAETVRTLHREAPGKFTAPTGFEHRIHYDDHGAFVEIRLQEMFGLTKTPRLAFGHAPLTFRLLSPAYRPVQVTSDIEGFWSGAYVDVRKELRARYPKHSWPENPLLAKPEAKGRRR